MRVCEMSGWTSQKVSYETCLLNSWFEELNRNMGN